MIIYDGIKEVGKVCKEVYELLGYKRIAALIAVFAGSIAAMKIHEDYFPEKTLTIPIPWVATEKPAPDPDLENIVKKLPDYPLFIKDRQFTGSITVGDQAAADDTVGP